MTAYTDRSCPVGYQSWYVFTYDWLSKHSTVKDISDGSVWRFPHLLEIKLFYTLLIRSDGSAFDTYAVFFNGIGGIYSHLVIGSIAVLNAKVIIFNVHIYIWKNKFILNKLPNNSGHLISVQFNNRIGYFNFCTHIK